MIINKFLYITLLSLLLILGIVSCSTQSHNDVKEGVSEIVIWNDTVIKSKYDDGSIHTVWGFQTNDNDMHYEWQYYRNGNLWLEGPKYDTIRHGIWKGYNEQGSLLAQGTYKIGKASGIYTVWYDNGVKFYEGNMLNGKRVGEWSFYDKERNIIKVIDYSKKDIIE